jgi:hypothetical protein
MRELIPFAGAKFKGGGSMRNSTEAKLRVAKLLADEVGAVRRRIRAVGGGRSMSGERGGVLKQEQGIRVVVKRVRDGGGLGFDGECVVAAIVMNGGAKVKCSVTVVGPAWSRVRAEMGDTKLSRGVDGMGTKVKFVSI